MKRGLCICVIYLFWVSASHLGAEQVSDHDFELNSEMSHITYKEPGLMEEKGEMYGAEISYTYRRYNPPLPTFGMMRFAGRMSYGTVDYSSAVSGTLDTIEDRMWEMRVVAGCGVCLSDRTKVTPYTGVGIRYLNDDTGGMVSSKGDYGYERESRYYYSPIGLETSFAITQQWSVGMSIEYDYFWEGCQTSRLSDVNLGYSDVKNRQTDGYGYRGALRLEKKTEQVDIIVESFLRKWKISDSEIDPVYYNNVLVGYGYEPKNESTEYGLKAGVKF
ncbi:MAG: hypothetical protein JW844_07905 [Candidatus Omnitrophica bacterium]|nr:hypothetical protein [Candidatus Omnitrophota bacterium]